MNINQNENESIVITRKYAIIPETSKRKEWNKKMKNFVEKEIESMKDYIDYIDNEIDKKNNKKKDKERLQKQKEKVVNRLNKYQRYDAYINDIVMDYTYDLIRYAMEDESRKKNYILTWMYSKMIENGVQYMSTLKEKYKFITETINYAYRARGSNKGSLFDDTEIGNILGGYGVGFSQELTKKIKDMVKNGLLDGGCSLVNYKLDAPFTVTKQTMGFSHDFDSFEELCEHIDDSDCQLYFDYGSKGLPTIARFRINLGYGKNRNELKSTLLKVYSGEYQYCGSKIGIEKNKIILYLSLKIPKVITELNENIVVGVDLGAAIPATCALNNNPYDRLYIGSVDDFIRIRTQLQNQRKRAQRSLKMSKGGHGRKKKLAALNRFRDKESHFVETYSHKVSKQIVDFALKHHAKYINIENLKGYDTDEFILRNWSYYKLQQYITYKAERYGIEVRKINPCYTSQVCSYCGCWEPGQRKTQKDFVCANKDCITNNKSKFKHTINADFNAARNIAMSTLFVDDSKEISKNDAKKAREYYGFSDKYEEYESKKKDSHNNKKSKNVA